MGIDGWMGSDEEVLLPTILAGRIPALRIWVVVAILGLGKTAKLPNIAVFSHYIRSCMGFELSRSVWVIRYGL